MNIVLLEPEIPPNTGNVARLCAATKSVLHLIEPFGFKLDDSQLKRAGMDYWQHVEWHRWKNWTAFAEKLPADARLWFIESGGGKIYSEVKFSPDDFLIFGRETAGLPKQLSGTTSRTLAADSDVQREIAFAEFVELRRAGFVRGVAAAGISKGRMKNEEATATPLAAAVFSFSFFILHSTFPLWPGDWRSGSAAPLHGDGRGFESLIAHQPSLFELRLGKPAFARLDGNSKLFLATSVPSRRNFIFRPRHSTVLPAKAQIQSATCSKSFSGTSQNGEINFRSGVKRRCRFCASTIRISKNAIAVSGAQKVFAAASETKNQSSGQSVALERMLKK